MTRVRGKEALNLNHVSEVVANTYGCTVSVIVHGQDSKGDIFTARGDLSMHCAKNLVRNLRRAMRKVRDEAVERLNKAVTEAEGPL